jgi:hypothetical protein
MSRLLWCSGSRRKPGRFLWIRSLSAGASMSASVPRAIPKWFLFEQASYKQIKDCMRFKDLMEAYIKIIVFYDVKPVIWCMGTYLLACMA